MGPELATAMTEEDVDMSDSAKDDTFDVLDARNHALKAGFRKALEDAAVDEAARYFTGYPDSLRSLLKEGAEGISLMSDTRLLAYAINSMEIGEVGGYSLVDLASQLGEIDALDDHQYRVCWETDVNASSPVHATRFARDQIRAAGSTANVFEVQNHDVTEEQSQIDLLMLDLERHSEARRESEADLEPN